MIGDIDASCFPSPVDNITFWAPFANEPSIGQKVNSQIDLNLNGNYKDRSRTCCKLSESMIYKLVATRRILPEEEIVWYYGKDYSRDYPLGICY